VSRITADSDALIRVAESQLGVAESPAFSNRTPYCTWYGLVGPWCAMFVSWVFAHAGHTLPRIRTSKGFSYCPDIVNWAKKNGVWHASGSGYKPKRGDIVLFDFIGRPSHVGIVTGVLPDGRIATIEGNTNGSGSRDGGRVMRHNRSAKGSTIGFVEVDGLKKPAKPRPWRNVLPGDDDRKRGGHDAAEAQILLKVLAKWWKAPELDPGEVTGVWDARSQRAVSAFKKRIIALQKATGSKTVWKLTDGIVGPATISMLRWWVAQQPR
jgi:hypothetical protein